MADFEKAVQKVIRREGGAKFTDIAEDKGGATKYGISQRAFPNENIRNLTEARAKELYRLNYWNKAQGDKIASQAVAESVFDACVNMGVKPACKLAQLAVDVIPVDGIVGKDTLKALNAVDEDLFLAKFALEKVGRYAAICNKDRTQSKFLLGWINRTMESA